MRNPCRSMRRTQLRTLIKCSGSAVAIHDFEKKSFLLRKSGVIYLDCRAARRHAMQTCNRHIRLAPVIHVFVCRYGSADACHSRTPSTPLCERLCAGMSISKRKTRPRGLVCSTLEGMQSSSGLSANRAGIARPLELLNLLIYKDNLRVDFH
jgi:hypothetical protein